MTEQNYIDQCVFKLKEALKDEELSFLSKAKIEGEITAYLDVRNKFQNN